MKFDRDIYVAEKCQIANAFSALEQANNISESEKTTIRVCLSNYNSMLDADAGKEDVAI